MTRARLLLICNGCLAISALLQIITGVILACELKFADDLHAVNGFIMTALVVLHVYLNWGWFRSHFFQPLQGARRRSAQNRDNT